MPSDRAVRISHSVLFGLTLLVSIIALIISATLVAHYNKDGYPPVHTSAYTARIRILLVASVWMTAFGIILTVGFQLLGNHVAFGILSHLVPTTIGFILYVIGAASLTALTDKIDCGKSGDSYSRCGVVKGLVVISWIDTIILLITLVFLITLAFVARGRYGVHKSTLYAD
ncbi:uncharacterized protein I303_106668 [Kwoniella dejecticola CBS 10117]|uniref:MARVEL domain-containing protein n=1 Tax=Kwoniella dejecticola CBS 10117 TaxID=1296121 RepID=A0A1A5ZU17_9TREE|nr:uncharacterized protein I303_08689 [Kwoniella dejecticola CBS 10117]OBR81303.1 hypothetical protein I303_08689 [Kwoniella dejecticola CBS 10117]